MSTVDTAEHALQQRPGSQDFRPDGSPHQPRDPRWRNGDRFRADNRRAGRHPGRCHLPDRGPRHRPGCLRSAVGGAGRRHGHHHPGHPAPRPLPATDHDPGPDGQPAIGHREHPQPKRVPGTGLRGLHVRLAGLPAALRVRPAEFRAAHPAGRPRVARAPRSRRRPSAGPRTGSCRPSWICPSRCPDRVRPDTWWY